MVDALAWPTVVLIIVFLFKKELPEMIGRIEVLKYRDFELRMHYAFRELPKYLEKARDVCISPIRDDSSPFELRFQKSLDVSPALAVIDAWTEVERTLCEAAIKAKVFDEGNKRFPMYIMLKGLEKLELVRKSQTVLIWRLRDIRNAIVRAPAFNLSESDAHTYIDAALAVILSVQDRMTEKIPKGSEAAGCPPADEAPATHPIS